MSGYLGDEYDGDGDDGKQEDTKKKGKKKGTGKPKKDQDPNTLVEIVQGIYECYGLMVYLSEWKKGTLLKSEWLELEVSQQPHEVVQKEQWQLLLHLLHCHPTPMLEVSIAHQHLQQ